MLKTYVLTIFAIPVLMVLWMAVQFAWRRAFPEVYRDVDVLAGRQGCDGCGCTGTCEREMFERNGESSMKAVEAS